MKSQVNALLRVAGGILEDVRRSYPALEDGLSKDLDRLALYCQTRDLELFTLDLPHLESLLLKGLEDGRLILEGPLSKRVSRKTQVPRLFSGLWLRVFDDNACLKQEVDVNALYFLRCLLVIGKKIKVEPTRDRTLAKVGEYHDIERSLRHPSFTWEADELRLRAGGRFDPSKGRDAPHSRDRNHYGFDHDHPSLFVSALSKESALADDWGDLVTVSDDDEWSRNHMSVHIVQALDYIRPEMVGPSGLFRMEESDSPSSRKVEDFRLLNKIQQVADLIFSTIAPFDPISYSANLEEEGHGIGFRHGPGAVAERLKNWDKTQFPNWPHKLEKTFPFRLCGTTPLSLVEQPSFHEMAARLIAVPKTAKGPRLIAAEPASHQWCQQLTLRFLFDQCRKIFGSHFIDFKNQSLSGDMVLRASLDRQLATVDLSDASDRLTCWTVERLLRKNPSLLIALHAARTRYIRDEISDIPNFLSLRKFASQGTATTFPVMSLVMLCIALGSTFSDTDVITWESLRRRRSQVRVFGDDIILPTHGYERLVRAMELLQLKVNVAKSYVNGHFRESCGVDGYLGYDITPIKPKTLIADSPASCQAVVDTSNNLFNKGLWYASRTAESLVPTQVRKYLRIVGNNGAGSRGLTSFCGGDERHLEKRWNPRLHRDEVRVWTISVRTVGRPRKDVGGIVDFFTRSHTTFNPRVVSQYLDVRKTISRLLWEPTNADARAHD
nr:MAG: hypothetical protein 3 [Leviviridae sp.]